MEYACLAYDVPLSQRSLYNKLKRRIRGIGLQMTSSVYIIPLGARSTVQAILDELESEKPNVIDSCIIKYDDSEEKVILAKAQQALNRLVRTTKETVIKKLEEAEKLQKEHVAKYDELIAKKEKNAAAVATSMDELQKFRSLELSLYEASVKKHLKKAENALKDAKKLAVLFNMTNNMEAAFMAMDAFTKQKWELIGVKPTTKDLVEVE